MSSQFDIARFFYSINVTALSVNVLSFNVLGLHRIDFCPYDLLDLPSVLIHGVYSFAIAVNLPYFDLLY